MKKKTNIMPNRLINEKSPYLLQHAYNPVDWYPWGEEAFKKAIDDDKLIFLSIGYSTCHWCHAMAHDAFSDESTAEYLNANYVSIKVDREERPDIDEAYMLACQLLSNNCGWPLNIVMTPEKKPIFAATYLPSKESFGSRALISILEEIKNIWQNDRNKIIEVGDMVLSRIETIQKETIKEEIGKDTLEKAFDYFTNNFDKNYGGFGSAPKFPSPHNLNFLLNWYKKSKRQHALQMVEKTFNSMYQGGIFDHISGGFHRYSTDNMWRLPHFEKMLYDQALVADAYLEAYQITKNELYADVAKKTLNFVLRELTSPEGGFYSGLDADTEGEEGKFYIWTKDEIYQVLESDTESFCEYYGITEDGNLSAGKNILFESHSTQNPSEKEKINLCLEKLYNARSQRTYPHIDDKIITSWNGLMIKSLAFAGQIFNEEKYKTAAIKAAGFIKKQLITAEGEVFRSFREEKSNIAGFLDDYAFLAYGLLELYQSNSDSAHLELAEKITETMISQFYDEINGGFYATSINTDTPLVRMKSAVDQAIPSGNSIAALVLLILENITKNQKYLDMANDTFYCFGYSINRFPASHSQFLIALMRCL